MNNYPRQSGISMVEILVALVISVFLLGGIIQVYLGNKTTYSFTNAISQVQENGRYAMDIMTQDFRMASFWGCAGFNPGNTDMLVNNLNPADANFERYDFVSGDAIEGTENDGLNGSDSISLRGAKPSQDIIKLPYNDLTSAGIELSNKSNIKVDDIVLISNCNGADIFRVTGIADPGANDDQITVLHTLGGKPPGNINPNACGGGHCLSQSYGADAAMFRLQSITYSIQAGESGEPALWRSENGKDEEIVEGVQEMQIRYGVDTDNDNFPNQYVIYTPALNMQDVISVRIMLLVRSSSNFVTEGNQSYTFNGDNLTAADRRLRQVFTTTIALRNRVGI